MHMPRASNNLSLMPQSTFYPNFVNAMMHMSCKPCLCWTDVRNVEIFIWRFTQHHLFSRDSTANVSLHHYFDLAFRRIIPHTHIVVNVINSAYYLNGSHGEFSKRKIPSLHISIEYRSLMVVQNLHGLPP